MKIVYKEQQEKKGKKEDQENTSEKPRKGAEMKYEEMKIAYKELQEKRGKKDDQENDTSEKSRKGTEMKWRKREKMNEWRRKCKEKKRMTK